MSTCYALLCRGLTKPPILAIGVEAVLASAERVDDPERVTLKGVRLVITTCIRLTMLDKLHEGHQGVVRCRSRAQSSVCWPGLSRQLEELVRSCTACAVERRNPSEPMIASETVLIPWQTVGTDLFVYKNATYLLVVSTKIDQRQTQLFRKVTGTSKGDVSSPRSNVLQLWQSRSFWCRV